MITKYIADAFEEPTVAELEDAINANMEERSKTEWTLRSINYAPYVLPGDYMEPVLYTALIVWERGA